MAWDSVKYADSVIVVGAGIAGLTAAHRLAAAGIDVTVFEASPAPGGRMTSVDVVGGRMECGAQFLSTAYEVVPDLIEAAGLGEDVVTVTGRSMVRLPSPGGRGGHDRAFDTDKPHTLLTGRVVPLTEVPSALRAMRALELLRHRSRADLGAWMDLDATGALVWARGHLGSAITERLLSPGLMGLYFTDITREPVSAAVAGAVGAFAGVHGSARKLRGGLGSLPVALAAGCDVEYGVRVEEVRREGAWEESPTSGAGVVLRVDRGEGDGPQDVQAARVILAVPAEPARRMLADPRPAEAAVMRADYNPALLVGVGLGAPARRRDLKGAYGVLVSPAERSDLASVAVASRSRANTPGADLLTVMMRPSAARRLAGADDELVAKTAVEALGELLPGVERRVLGTHVVRWEQALPQVPPGQAAAVHAYRSSRMSLHSRVVLAGDYLGFPWSDSAAFNGFWAAGHVISEL